MVRGDSFCADNGVSHIDYLKIDTKGDDFQALIGFGPMLSAGAIDFIQVEAGISKDATDHINIWKFEDFFYPLGYKLDSIKNQTSSHIPYLRSADVIFMREAAVRR
ncbi:hypothetical protein ASG52_19910 [Methylobacterium sp. Leaf456]|nr:hypothetical protein ASG52_19910 [Methylobacterium sp. Leaf456]